MALFRNIFLLMLVIVCSNFQTFSSQLKPAENDPGVDSFLNIFCKAAMDHNEARMMALMDDGYRMEQHDKFHKGNTTRFLNELFCGKVITEEKYKCLKFSKITRCEKVNIGEGEKEVAVIVRATVKKVSVDVFLTVKIVMKNGVKQYGIVGGVG